MGDYSFILIELRIKLHVSDCSPSYNVTRIVRLEYDSIHVPNIDFCIAYMYQMANGNFFLGPEQYVMKSKI